MEGCCGGPPFRHSGCACRFTISTSFSHLAPEGNVRTCSQQVLQELLAIGTVTRGKRTGKHRLFATSQPLRGRILLRRAPTLNWFFVGGGGAIHFYLPPEVTASRTSDLSSPHRFSAIDPSVSGGVGEWLKPPDLKSGKGASPSGVRIPPPPPSIHPESSSIIHKTACQTLQMLGSFKNNLQSCPKHSACIRDYLTV